jgi:hypothetical protein
MIENSLTIKKHTPVWTSDGRLLGQTMHVHHRLDGINPAQKFYASYLEVFSFEIGDRQYVPLEFIEQYDEANGRIILSATQKKAEIETWSRMPAFIANGRARKEDLID